MNKFKSNIFLGGLRQEEKSAMLKNRGFFAPKRNSFSEAFSTSTETDALFSLGCQSERMCLLRQYVVPPVSSSLSWTYPLNTETHGGPQNLIICQKIFHYIFQTPWLESAVIFADSKRHSTQRSCRDPPPIKSEFKGFPVFFFQSIILLQLQQTKRKDKKIRKKEG